MNKIQKQRLYQVIFLLFGLSIATALILYALKQNINVFLSPSEIASHQDLKQNFRLGGVVKKGSLQNQGLAKQFVVTDFKKEIT